MSKPKQSKAASPDSPDDRLAQAAVDKGHHPKVFQKRKHPDDDGDGTSSSPKRSKPGATETSEVESPEPKRKGKGKPDVPSSNLLKGKESASKLAVCSFYVIECVPALMMSIKSEEDRAGSATSY